MLIVKEIENALSAIKNLALGKNTNAICAKTLCVVGIV
jgi:hypothetical protein